ncbi:glycosyltransferase [Candidatus Saccharibacteria bacterium]|nr:glycosyltransferase [Candidatus Saccharibacteria bacterium]
MKVKKTLEINYNLDYLVILPGKDVELFDAFDCSFGNSLILNNTVEDVEFLIKFLRKNIVGQIIFVDYYAEYDEIINTLVEEHEIKFIFTGGLGELSDETILDDLNRICDKYDYKIADSIGFLDRGLYEVIRAKRRKVKHILLDIVHKKCHNDSANTNTIGLLNASGSDYCSFYNELASLTFLPGYKAKLSRNIDKVSREFIQRYHIATDFVDDDLVYGNACNLDVNFAGANATRFLASMDAGIPCVVGNNGFLVDKYPAMNEHLAVKSDDDVNEIAEKVRGAIENKEAIMKEYEEYRVDYSLKSVVSIENFLGFKVNKVDDEEFEKLLTVVVPVYNTKEYLAGCLDSIITASIPKMEILIIDDGSTDGSGVIAKEYVKRYPDKVRYIEQKNRGLGNVRNVGLRESKGKYVASVDSDDSIRPEFLEEALPFLKDDVDLVLCDWMSVAERESFETAALDWVFEKRKELEGLLYTTIMPSTCNKIMKKSLLTNNGIEYLEQKYEDLSANPRAFLLAKTVKYIHKPYYNYYLRSNSLMRSNIDPKHMVDVLKYLDDRLVVRNEAINLEEFKFYTYSWRIEEYIINPLYDLGKRDLCKDIKYVYDNVYELIGDVFGSKYYLEMLAKLKSNDLREYINARNEAFEKRKLDEYILSIKKPQKLSAGIIYYGD